METLFTCLILAQFLVIALHDWIDIPNWVHGRQVQEVVGRRRLAWATAINLIFPGIAVGFAIRYFHTQKPGYVLNYWVIYTAITVVSAFFMWWVPYLFGSSQQHRQEFAKMYGGTRHVLPIRKGDPGANLMHLFFHALFLGTLFLAVELRLES